MPAKTTPPPDDLRNPYGYSEMDWAAQLDPAYAAARAEVRRLSVGEDGTLSVKVKELIVLGVLASRGLQYGVEAHMRRAITYGATKEELFEAIKAAAVPGGGVAYSVGVRALQALEQAGVFAPPTRPQLRAAGGAPPLHCNRHTVGRWRSRYLAQGLSGLQDAPRLGRPRRFSPLSASGCDVDGHP
jgi:AhpD family alkylhydroperoxidase